MTPASSLASSDLPRLSIEHLEERRSLLQLQLAATTEALARAKRVRNATHRVEIEADEARERLGAQPLDPSDPE